MYIINFIRGFCMALADSVPGVSGGTIAFILGFYDDFINSLSSLTSRNGTGERKKALLFLFKLGIGWVVGMILSVLFLSSVFESHIYEISSLFVGFIICSIPLVIKEEKDVIRDKYKYLIFALIGILIVVAITYFNPVSSNSSMDLSLDNFSLGFAIYVFIAGMIAISAMVLPGISGSTLLLIFGLYAPIISSIKEVLTLNLSPLPMLIVFGVGVIVGILSTIHIIKYLLANYRSQMIYLTIGLMIGSIYPVFMGPTTLTVPLEPMNLHTFSLIYFIMGGALIFGLEKLNICIKNKTSKNVEENGVNG
ncbi:DUF368 domain-containing protein [Clostridium sp. MSJ-11]|uniref:DUF368 domain-containing protein n=1 Tax=Clostridium mobile TaxID=2841512 RepID=A0ABS6EHX6_9CLOT|nr:DUF368 domain-containing protein [Clostridium mobile]MBU5484833.1 DUF368 domain-containing protein [Clostridium mobile]